MIVEVKEMEDRLSAYLTACNRTEASIPGLKAILGNNEIIITEIPLADERQLNLLAEYFCLEYERRKVGNHKP